MPLNIDILYKADHWQKTFSPKIRQACTVAYHKYISLSTSQQAGAPQTHSQQKASKCRAQQNIRNNTDVKVSIVLANNAFVQKLNKRYRGKDKPTNVLSFGNGDVFLDVSSPVQFLGDIIVAYECVDQESQQQEKSFQDHCLHLIVHGMLHLLGLDHVEEQEANYMENVETAILKQLGVEDPYL